MLTVGPVVVAGSSYIAYNEIMGWGLQDERGFSGVVGAIDGFLILTIIQTFADEQTEPVAMLSLGVYFGYIFVGLGAVTSRLGTFGLGVGIWVVTGVAALTDYVASRRPLARWVEAEYSLAVLLACAGFVSVLAFAVALPPDIVSSSDGFINIVGHGAGIVFGMATHIGVRYVGA